MDFRHVNDENSHHQYQKYFNGLGQNEQETIKAEMREYLVRYQSAETQTFVKSHNDLTNKGQLLKVKRRPGRRS